MDSWICQNSEEMIDRLGKRATGTTQGDALQMARYLEHLRTCATCKTEYEDLVLADSD
jgi:D-arabinose 1-dehydrogenase-like Zn-dependent alcohol dehydrogenase